MGAQWSSRTWFRVLVCFLLIIGAFFSTSMLANDDIAQGSGSAIPCMYDDPCMCDPSLPECQPGGGGGGGEAPPQFWPVDDRCPGHYTPYFYIRGPQNRIHYNGFYQGYRGGYSQYPYCVYRYPSVGPDKAWMNRAEWYLPSNNPSYEGNYQTYVWIGCDPDLWKSNNARYQIQPVGTNTTPTKTINVDQYRPGGGCLLHGLFTQSPYKTYFDDTGYVGLIDRSSSHPTYIAADFAFYQK
jgi:hypothetical protein